MLQKWVRRLKNFWIWKKSPKVKRVKMRRYCLAWEGTFRTWYGINMAETSVPWLFSGIESTYFESGHTIVVIVEARNSKGLSMELFSRRRWATGSAQQSNNFGIMPCMCCIIFWVYHKHNSFLLGLIQPSSPNTKELHSTKACVA